MSLAARLRRLLFLVPSVARRSGGVPLAELAGELKMGEPELLADLDLLAQVGPPDGDPGEFLLVSVEDGRVFVDLAGRLTRPLRLTAVEGGALLLGLRALARAGIAPYDEALASAEKKLLRALGSEATAACELAESTVLEGPEGRVATLLRGLLSAARARQAVELEYASASSGRAAARVVEPYGVVQHAGVWYLVGRCRLRGDVRTFRVDRIVRLLPGAGGFLVPPTFDLEAYRGERLFVPGADATSVVVRLDALAAARVGAGWPTGEVHHLEGGGAEICLDCEGFGWLIGWVLGFGRHAVVVSPPEARLAIRHRLLQMKASLG